MKWLTVLLVLGLVKEAIGPLMDYWYVRMITSRTFSGEVM